MWQLNCPKCVDDLQYSLAPTEGKEYSNEAFWDADGEDLQSFHQYVRLISGHYLNSSSRLSNIVYIICNSLPLKVIKTICGLSIGLMFLGIFLISLRRDDLRKKILIVIGIFFLWFMFPWHDCMQSSVFVYNYALSSCLLLFWLYCFKIKDKFSPLKRVIFAGYTLFFASFHEGFTVAIGAFLFFYMVLNKKWDKYNVILFSIIFIGFLNMILWGTFYRLGFIEETVSLSIKEKIKYSGLNMFFDLCAAIVAFIVLFVSRIFSHKVDRDIYLKELYPYFAAVVSSVFLYFFVATYSRTIWCGIVFSMIIVLEVLSYSIKNNPKSKFYNLIMWVILIIYALWLFELCRWQRITLNSEIERNELLSPRGTYQCDVIYHDEIYCDRFPFYLMDIPISLFDVNDFYTINYAHYWIGRNSEGSVILPGKYRDLPFDSIPVIPGNAGFRGGPPILLSNKVINGSVRIKVGEFEEGSNPIIKTISVLRNDIFGKKSDEYYRSITPRKIVMPDSTVVYGYFFPPSPKTLRWRVILEIDTI